MDMVCWRDLADVDAIAWDGLDDAIVGVATIRRYGRVRKVLIYAYDTLCDAFIAGGMDADDAEDWIDYNIRNAWHGDGTPLLI